MKKLDMTNVKEAGEFARMPAGAYICVIRKVDDFSDKEYLKVTYDIAEGEFAGHFDEIRKDHPDWEWSGAYVKSYKQAALPMFKRFCSAVSKSNGNFVFDGGAINSDETTLIGKKVGLLFREEEYYGNDGALKTRLAVHREFPIGDIDKQKVPDVKRLEGAINQTVQKRPDPNEFMPIPDTLDEKLPF